MFLKHVDQSRIARAASRTSWRGGQLPRARGHAAPYPARKCPSSVVPDPANVGQLWGVDWERDKPILGVMSFRIGT